jgi:hypothetical protein
MSKHVKIRIYRNIIFSVVLCGCETWSLKLRAEHRLRAFVKRLLRILGPKGKAVTGGWIKLHNEELYISIV